MELPVALLVEEEEEEEGGDGLPLVYPPPFPLFHVLPVYAKTVCIYKFFCYRKINTAITIIII